MIVLMWSWVLCAHVHHLHSLSQHTTIVSYAQKYAPLSTKHPAYTDIIHTGTHNIHYICRRWVHVDQRRSVSMNDLTQHSMMHYVYRLYIRIRWSVLRLLATRKYAHYAFNQNVYINRHLVWISHLKGLHLLSSVVVPANRITSC